MKKRTFVNSTFSNTSQCIIKMLNKIQLNDFVVLLIIHATKQTHSQKKEEKNV